MNIFTKVTGLAQQTRYVQSAAFPPGPSERDRPPLPSVRGVEVGGPVPAQPAHLLLGVLLCYASNTSFPKSLVE